MRTRKFFKSGLLLIVFSFIIALQILAQTNKINFPVILSEKANYQTNETVSLSGQNFQPFERVSLAADYQNTTLKEGILLNRWDAYADQNGRISSFWKIPDLNQTGLRFTVGATGTITGITAKTEFSTLAPAATSVDLKQCANSNAVPQNLNCLSNGNTGWVTGLVGANRSSYFEGNSIAYRNVIADLTPGTQYKWTVEYDTTKGGLNAIDYVTTFNETITNANPCQDGANANAFCTAGAPNHTFAIPSDQRVLNGRDQIPGNADDILQIPGEISIWGGTITNVTAPVYTGTFPNGDTSASVDISFTATAATAVIAWAGHIATRNDWGQAFGSVNISGSPYHTRNGGLMDVTNGTTCCGGSQDLQLSDAAVVPSARIVIIKHATPPSVFQFGFTTNNLAPANFQMVDNSISTDPMQAFDNITTFDVKTITETTFAPYTLTSIVCTVDINTGGTPIPIRNGNAINIDIKSGDQVTCTFNNDFTTAAAVDVTGRVFDLAGNGLPRATVSMTDANGSIRTVMTNPFGYFRFEEVEAGESYFFNVRHKSYVFTPQLIDVSEDINGLAFIPN